MLTKTHLIFFLLFRLFCVLQIVRLCRDQNFAQGFLVQKLLADHNVLGITG